MAFLVILFWPGGPGTTLVLLFAAFRGVLLGDLDCDLFKFERFRSSFSIWLTAVAFRVSSGLLFCRTDKLVFFAVGLVDGFTYSVIAMSEPLASSSLLSNSIVCFLLSSIFLCNHILCIGYRFHHICAWQFTGICVFICFTLAKT